MPADSKVQPPAASTDAGDFDQRAASFRLTGGRVACLLLHGFTATPEEMRFLGEALHARGYTVSGPRVAGHGTRDEDLERTRWQDWYASARANLMELREQNDELVVVGQSMGGLLALCLAAEHPRQVQSLILLSPALRLVQGWLSWVRPLLPILARRRPYLAKGDVGDLRDPGARAVRLGYQRIPVRALHQLLLLQAAAQRALPRVRQPALVIQSRQDHTCSLAGVEVLRRKLGGPLQTLILEDSYHVVSVDVDKERVAERVGQFLADTVAGPR